MKAQIQIQFNWMFVMIVGAIILIFFTNIVLKQDSIQDAKVAVTVINDLETIATGAGVSKDTAQNLKKPDIDLEISCDDCYCTYSMVGNSKQFGDKVIFGPKRVIGRNMIAWSQDWNAPFRVTNFLYLTSPQTVYYIVDRASSSFELGLYINETLPTSIVRIYSDETDSDPLADGISDNNYPSMKFVYIVDTTTECPGGEDISFMKTWGVEREDISAVCIHGFNPDDYSKGQVTFYKLDPSWETVVDGSTLQYIGDESVFAAIFAADYEIFSCNIKSAFKRMAIIGEIYRKRTDDLIYQHPSCVSDYQDCEQELSYLVSNSTHLSSKIDDSFDDYYDIMGNLSYYNMQLQIRSCPSIY